MVTDKQLTSFGGHRLLVTYTYMEETFSDTDFASTRWLSILESCTLLETVAIKYAFIGLIH